MILHILMLLMVSNRGDLFLQFCFVFTWNGLLNELSKSNVGCHIGGVFAGVFGYADDLKLLTPSVHEVRILSNICEKYAAKYDITFNGKKSQLIIYKCKWHGPQTLVFLSIMLKFPG